jgi:hypothetical protein
MVRADITHMKMVRSGSGLGMGLAGTLADHEYGRIVLQDIPGEFGEVSSESL